MGTDIPSVKIVEQYLSFFQERGHLLLPASPLAVPGSSTSFVIAGMQPLLPYLRGLEPPPSQRLISFQRSLRTDDASAVGLNGRKLTLFHMLGNWSIGEYGKHEAIAMALDLLLNTFSLDQAKLWVTVFKGDASLGISLDEAAMQEWQSMGIPGEHIVLLGAEDNLWTMGDTGPCGPCTEIYVDRGIELGCGKPTCHPGCECERFLEIWNLVFMEYERFADGHLETLPVRNIDTGMGLERMAAVLQNTESVFTIDLFMPAMEHLKTLFSSEKAIDRLLMQRGSRLIVDHTRAALFAGLAGIEPGRDGRNSVVRRLIRRALCQGRLLGIEHSFLSELIDPLVDGHRDILTIEEQQRIPALTGVFVAEERLFAKVLSSGFRYLDKLVPDGQGQISGELLFDLEASRGFPSDLAAEVLVTRGLIIDWLGYERALEKHREISRVSLKSHFQSSERN